MTAGSVSGEKDEVDPISMLLFQLHNQLNFKEITTLAAIVDVPAQIRFNIIFQVLSAKLQIIEIKDYVLKDITVFPAKFAKLKFDG